jgi:proteasome lid subunit RPN8/RPN11
LPPEAGAFHWPVPGAPLPRPAPVVTACTLSDRVNEVIGAHAGSHYPLEACGLLLGHRDHGVACVTGAVACANVADPSQRGHAFAIDPRDTLTATRSLEPGQSVLGFFHSHPDVAAEPSTTDMDFIRLWPRTVWLIVPVFTGRPAAARAWWLDSPHDTAARELPVRVIRDTLNARAMKRRTPR